MRLALPLFIVFEGIDGSGKTTLSNMVYSYYISRNFHAVKLKEPTDGKWGRDIREMLRGEGETVSSVKEQMKLFLLDREDDVRRNIMPSIDRKEMIIMDRYYFSNAAYQGAMGMSPDSIIFENRKREFPEPHRVYLIDIEPEEALRRIAKRNKTGSDIFEKKSFLKRVRDIYHSKADGRFVIIDGAESLGTSLRIIKKDIEKNFSIS